MQKRKVSGADTYKLVNGVYVNTPFLENPLIQNIQDI